MTPTNDDINTTALEPISTGTGIDRLVLTWFRHSHVLSLGMAPAGATSGALVGPVLAKVTKTTDVPVKFVTIDCTEEDVTGYHKVLIIADTLSNAIMAAEAKFGTAEQQLFPSSKVTPTGTVVGSGGRLS